MEYVRDRASSHPKWSQQFEDEIKSHGNGNVEETLVEIIQTLQYRTRTPPEVCEQFIRVFLDGRDAPVNIEYGVVESILDQVRTHPKWPKFIEKKHRSSAKSAEDEVATAWKMAVERAGALVMPKTFASHLKREVLDPCGALKLDEAGAKASGMSVRVKRLS